MTSGASTEVDPWRDRPGVVQASGTATLALAAGLASFVCLFGLGGVLAIALGWIAHGEIERAHGRLTGKGLASAGIALGIANVVLSLVALASLIALAARPALSSSAPPPRPKPAATVARPAAPRAPAAPPSSSGSGEAPRLPPQIGRIAIAEVAMDGAGFEEQLRFQLADSARAGERLVLWTVKPDCQGCEAVRRALPDARMQRALSGVRLLRADAESFARELERLGVPTEQVPGFTLLDARCCRARDHIHSAEWDDDVPSKIAPIFEKFLRHALTKRRHPWARPLRQGETKL